MHVSQASLTSLARLVEPAWLVKSCLTNVKLVEMDTMLTNVRLVLKLSSAHPKLVEHAWLTSKLVKPVSRARLTNIQVSRAS